MNLASRYIPIGIVKHANSSIESEDMWGSFLFESCCVTNSTGTPAAVEGIIFYHTCLKLYSFVQRIAITLGGVTLRFTLVLECFMWHCPAH